MWRLFRFLQRRQDARDTTIPAVCYGNCNEAYAFTQIIGKTSQLCDNSSYTTSLADCEGCVDSNNNSDSTYIYNELAQYIDFCNAVQVTSSFATDAAEPTIPVSYLTSYASYTLSTLSDLPVSAGASDVTASVISVFIDVTSTLPAWYFHLSVSSLVNKYIPPAFFTELAADVASAASAASVTGDPTDLIYQALEATSAPSWFANGVPSTYSSQLYTLESEINELRATPVPTNTSGPGSSSNPTSASKAWIAGPIIGALVAIGLLLGGISIYIRRQKQRKAQVQQQEGNVEPEKQDKPQLHSEHLPRRQLYEMDAGYSLSEMNVNEGGYHGASHPELPANEVAAQEMRV